MRREEHNLRVLRRIFGCKLEEMTGNWRRLYREELHDWWASSNIIRVITSRRMRLAGMWHVGER
jgi:hypothetical protein